MELSIFSVSDLTVYWDLTVYGFFFILCALGNCMSEFMGLIHGSYEAKVGYISFLTLF